MLAFESETADYIWGNNLGSPFVRHQNASQRLFNNTILTKNTIDYFPLISVQKHGAIMKISGILEQRVVPLRIELLQLLETGTEGICAHKSSGTRIDP